MFIPLLKLVLTILALGILFGVVVGIVTYGRPHQKQRGKNIGWVDDSMELGITMIHRLIDRLLGKQQPSTESVVDNQTILAMLRGMSPSLFENFMAEVFASFGYDVRVTGGSSDGGIDMIMTKDGKTSVVQCKKFITKNVTPHDLRDFFGAMVSQRVDGKGFFVTTNIFTLEAERFAEGKPIELIDASALPDLVRKSGVSLPVVSVSISSGKESCPRCGSVLVERENKKTGNTFFGCSKFPKCRYTKPT